ncbi:MAG: MaoC family dehydratase N-terminal domain-containing protein [Dehalococcoidia bacterium]|nr:MaoC family dehydratase N-terminal domain-containing protein [Dehalococcoidia bacterium]MCA9824379.1 MaoC family dehydratase N-terminal domain-containing protein [Dehalococcoidia bacterium]
MTETESLIPPEALEQIDRLVGEPQSATISRRESQRYAWAAGDLNPIYFDEAAAREAGYDGLVVPPTLLGWIMEDGRPLDQLREDGLYKGRRQGIGLRVSRTMFGGQEYDFVEPIYVGDTITAETRLKGLEEKVGSSGPFVLTTQETTYTNQHGRVVARGRVLSIAR